MDNEQEEKAKQEKTEKHIEKLEKYADSTQKAIEYSIERFDILIISLSSSSLVVSIGFVKNLFTDFKSIDTSLLKFSWLLFALALIMNLLSQVTGYFANRIDLDITNDIIRTKQGKDSKMNQICEQCIMSVLNTTTQALNLFSLFAFISGISVLIYFISNNV